MAAPPPPPPKEISCLKIKQNINALAANLIVAAVNMQGGGYILISPLLMAIELDSNSLCWLNSSYAGRRVVNLVLVQDIGKK